MVKKIGIATIHRNTNPGSILQAYSQAHAFQSYLKDYNVEIIDIRFKSQEFKLLESILFNCIQFKFQSLQEYFLYKNFINKNLPLSNQTIFSDDYYKSLDSIKNKYDIIILKILNESKENIGVLELGRRLSMGHLGINRHISRLIEQGLITKTQMGKNKTLVLKTTDNGRIVLKIFKN